MVKDTDMRPDEGKKGSVENRKERRRREEDIFNGC